MFYQKEVNLNSINPYNYSNYINEYKSFALDEEYSLKEEKLYQEKFFYFDKENISITRNISDKEECWKIFVKGKEITISTKSKKLTEKEKQFLRTSEGIKFLLDKVKSGWKSLAQFKRDLNSLVN
jgi:hypothetical protein